MSSTRRDNELHFALNDIKLSKDTYQYRLNDELGSGASGSVYKVKDINTNNM